MEGGGCKEFERAEEEGEAEGGTRRRGGMGGGARHGDYDAKVDLENAKVETKPDAREFLQPYVDAMDPEAGIEEEYHPKNDSVYMWRAGRVIGGDVKAGIRRVWEEACGEVIPEYEEKEEVEGEDVEADEEKEGTKETEKKDPDDSVDVSMDVDDCEEGEEGEDGEDDEVYVEDIDDDSDY